MTRTSSRALVPGLVVVVLVTTACGGDESTVASDQAELDAELIDAAWNDDIDRADDLITAGADVNAKDHTVQSAFLIAASEGHTDLLRLTLEHGADVTATDTFNGTALIRAAERGHAEAVAVLIDAGVDVDHINNLGWTALHEAIILGDGSPRYVETVRLLVEGGADLTIPSGPDGRSPLQHAEQRGQTAVATLIRERIATPSDG